ncbi:CDA7L protein, partial [Polypterus senegalus]
MTRDLASPGYLKKGRTGRWEIFSPGCKRAAILDYIRATKLGAWNLNPVGVRGGYCQGAPGQSRSSGWQYFCHTRECCRKFIRAHLELQNIHFQSKYITDELKKIFTEDTETEDEEFEGFVEPSFELNKRMKSMSMHPNKGGEEDGFSSDEDQIATRKKRSSGLCVAFRFPLKKSLGKQTSLVKHELSDSESEKERNGLQRSRTKLGRCGPSSDSECEEGSSVVAGQSKALEKRAKNIKENKEMKQKKSPKKTSVEGQSGRRNPSRSARPPERFGVECFSVSPTKLMERLNSIGKRATLQKKLLEMSDLENSRSPRRRSSKHGVSRSVTDITEEELENVAITSKDKLYDKINGSTCHQCRQKTIDTKTVCRNPDCWGVRGQFCGPCLRNRYGEDVRAALLDAVSIVIASPLRLTLVIG